MPAGTYDVKLSESGFVQKTLSNVVIAAGGTVDFGAVGLVAEATISGTLTSTVSGSPAEGIVVTASSNDAVFARAVADAAGHFTLDGSPPAATRSISRTRPTSTPRRM